jgi:hypothetical protein
VYAFRYGDGDHVKIGKTRNLPQRAKSLQVAHHNSLVLTEFIEHEDYMEGEKYIHRLLESRRVRQSGNGSREHFCVNDAELTEAFAKTRTYLNDELPLERLVQEYAALPAGKDILPATDENLQAKQRLAELQAARAQLQPELDLLDGEIRRVQDQQRPERERLERQLDELDAEERRLMTRTKLAIGPAGGIYGVATWPSVPDRCRHFDQKSLEEHEPELYEAYLTAFDQPRFRQEQPAAYEDHMRVTTHREFRWADHDDTASDTDAPGTPSSRLRRAVTRIGTRDSRAETTAPADAGPSPAVSRRRRARRLVR